jgi:tight adherence protein B
MFAGAVRVGLGLRQALIHVAEQSPEPARRELTRVVAAANIGVPLVDALDELAHRMNAHETHVLVRLLRVQAQTGSDLAAVLEGLADTIRDRRRFHRKVRAITAQGRMSAWFLGLLPLVIGFLVFMMGPDLRASALGTGVGHLGLALALTLDAAAVLVLLRVTKVTA